MNTTNGTASNGPGMNGAESLLRTLVASGVEVCFANPGTSEMHFVSAIDRVDGMRPVLGLFEGVVTGMADGYARMAERPAATNPGPPGAWGLALALLGTAAAGAGFAAVAANAFPVPGADLGPWPTIGVVLVGSSAVLLWLDPVAPLRTPKE